MKRTARVRPCELVLVLALTAVAASASPKARPAPVSLALHQDAALAAAGFSSPLVALTVGGQRAMFLVDTGAGVHTVARWFASASGLPVRATNRTVVGSTGHESRVEIVSNVRATLDDHRRLALPQALVAEFPQVFESLRIGGLVSPQLLAGPGEEVVLDLVRSRLTIRPAAPPDEGERASADDDRGRVCINQESPFRNRLFAVPARIEGAARMLLVDTGATATTVAEHSPAGRALAERGVAGGHSQGVGGAIQTLELARAVAVERGGSAVVLDLRLGAAVNDCGPDGLLGMDALAGCVLRLRHAGFAMTCSP